MMNDGLSKFTELNLVSFNKLKVEPPKHATSNSDSFVEQRLSPKSNIDASPVTPNKYVVQRNMKPLELNHHKTFTNKRDLGS